MKVTLDCEGFIVTLKKGPFPVVEQCRVALTHCYHVWLLYALRGILLGRFLHHRKCICSFQIIILA